MDAVVPDVVVQRAVVLDAAVSDVAVSCSAVPDVTSLDTTVPDVALPDVALPDAAVPSAPPDRTMPHPLTAHLHPSPFPASGVELGWQRTQAGERGFCHQSGISEGRWIICPSAQWIQPHTPGFSLSDLLASGTVAHGPHQELVTKGPPAGLFRKHLAVVNL